jgi:EpsI family protein
MIVSLAADQQRTFSRRAVLSGLLMASAAGLAAVRKPDIVLNYLGAHKLADVIPSRIGRWQFVENSGVIVPPEDQLESILYSDLLTRVYADGDKVIMLLIAYSGAETGFLQVHRPEFCYTAAGFTLSNPGEHVVELSPSKSIVAQRLNATRNGSVEKLVYWTRVGNRIPTSWANQRLAIAKDNLRRIIPDAALMRISTNAPGDQEAFAEMDQFIRQLIESIPPSLRRVFVA